jgi:hypothetical protein
VEVLYVTRLDYYLYCQWRWHPLMMRLYRMKAHIRSHLQECRLAWIHPTPLILTIRQSMCSIQSIIRWLNQWFNGEVNPSLLGLRLVLHLIWQILQSLLKAMFISALWICTCPLQFDRYEGMSGAGYKVSTKSIIRRYTVSNKKSILRLYGIGQVMPFLGLWPSWV